MAAITKQLAGCSERANIVLKSMAGGHDCEPAISDLLTLSIPTPRNSCRCPKYLRAARSAFGHKIRADRAALTYLGINTVSMAWMTPLSAATSAFTTLALFTIAPPMVLMVTSLPCTVVTAPAFRSLDITLPGTTW